MRKSHAIAPLALLAGTLAAAPGASAQCAPQWSSPSEFTPITYAMAVRDEGSGPALFAGGPAERVGGVIINHIGRWDGRTWSALGAGVTPSANVRAVVDVPPIAAPPGTDGLYVGGGFRDAGGVNAPGIARWHESRWWDVGGGLGPPGGSAMRSMHVFSRAGSSSLDPVFYISGAFEMAGTLPAVGMVQWDGQEWSAVPGWRVGGAYDMTVFDHGTGPALYVGGSFTSAVPVEAWNIARWDGDQWSSLQRGATSTVDALQVFDDGSGPSLYVGGGFPRVGEPGNWMYLWGLARWDGTEWHAVPGWDGGSVNDMIIHDDGSGPELYVAGSLSVGGVIAHVASFNGVRWRPLPALSGLGSGTNARSLAIFDDDGLGRKPPSLYVGGDFWWAGAVESPGLARWGCACYADWDPSTGIGVLDIFDFLCFQDAFVAGDPYADCDGSTTLDIFDFICFQDAVIAGCQ